MTIVCLNRQPESCLRNKSLQNVHINSNMVKITLSEYQEKLTGIWLEYSLVDFSLTVLYARAWSTQGFDCLDSGSVSIVKLCNLEWELCWQGCVKKKKKCSEKQGPVRFSKSCTEVQALAFVSAIMTMSGCALHRSGPDPDPLLPGLTSGIPCQYGWTCPTCFTTAFVCWLIFPYRGAVAHWHFILHS